MLLRALARLGEVHDFRLDRRDISVSTAGATGLVQ